MRPRFDVLRGDIDLVATRVHRREVVASHVGAAWRLGLLVVAQRQVDRLYQVHFHTVVPCFRPVLDGVRADDIHYGLLLLFAQRLLLLLHEGEVAPVSHVFLAQCPELHEYEAHVGQVSPAIAKYAPVRDERLVRRVRFGLVVTLCLRSRRRAHVLGHVYEQEDAEVDFAPFFGLRHVLHPRSHPRSVHIYAVRGGCGSCGGRADHHVLQPVLVARAQRVS
mgnify:CR=1 FL=1